MTCQCVTQNCLLWSTTSTRRMIHHSLPYLSEKRRETCDPSCDPSCIVLLRFSGTEKQAINEKTVRRDGGEGFHTACAETIRCFVYLFMHSFRMIVFWMSISLLLQSISILRPGKEQAEKSNQCQMLDTFKCALWHEWTSVQVTPPVTAQVRMRVRLQHPKAVRSNPIQILSRTGPSDHLSLCCLSAGS